MTISKGHREMGPDATAAHELLTELRTRISVQPLAYQDGDNVRALESLAEIFGHARKAMKDNPGCASFARITSDALNQDLRPITARWHPASIRGDLGTRDGAASFRSDLAEVRLKLLVLADRLHQMAYGTPFEDAAAPPALDPAILDDYFRPVAFGIRKGDLAETISGTDVVEKINHDEALEINARRGHAGPVEDAVGLALSGGGIRSASFCLGAAQGLADKGLLNDVDVLSTVSGGGYAGAFLSRQMVRETEDPSRSIRHANGPDTKDIRYLRSKVKYMAPNNPADKWSMVCSILAGMFLNWTAPAAMICGLVLILFVTAGQILFVTAGQWSGVAPYLRGVAFGVAVFAMAAYALQIRSNRTRAIRWFATFAGIAVAMLLLALLPRLYRVFNALTSSAGLSTTSFAMSALVAAAGPMILRIFGTIGRPLLRRTLMRVALVVASIAVPLIGTVFGFFMWDVAATPLQQIFDGRLDNLLPSAPISGAWFLACLTIVLGVTARYGISLNRSSPGWLYRNRLSNSFVARRDDQETNVPLTELNTRVTDNGMQTARAPYHLINTTLNLPSSRSPVLRERKGEFFVMSKHWTGAPSIGYWPTEQWHSEAGPLDLGTAIATSGAAVAPHMALLSVPSVTALLTFLNLRLGFWFQKPGVSDRRSSPGFKQLLQEMFGWRMDEMQDWYMLTDGAHIDNSGVYELLRRRSKFIILCDASAEAGESFSTLMTVVRHAQIDFGIRIEPQLDDLATNPETGQSAAHAVLSKIVYPDDAPGFLLTLRSSVTGNEPELIRRYRASHPEFPNQSTLDQSFDEIQFEAYRQLGVHTVDGLFASSLIGLDGHPPTVREWFRRLAATMLPRQPW